MCLRLLITVFTIRCSLATDRLKDSIFYSLKYQDTILSDLNNSFIPCFLYTDRENIYGCNSHVNGNIGEVQLFEKVKKEDNSVELSDIKQKILLMPHHYFTPKFAQLILSEKDLKKSVAGIIIDHSEAARNQIKPKSGYSIDSTCPNENLGLYGWNDYEESFSDCSSGPRWNPSGFDFTKTYFPFPIFLLQNETFVEDIKSCYNRTIDTKNKCTMKMRLLQHVNTPSKDCLNVLPSEDQSRCSPLGGNTIYSQLLDAKDTDPTPAKPIIWVTTKVDSKSFFWEYSPGQTGLTQIVALLSAIEVIGRAKKEMNFEESLSKQVVFTFMDAESYGYISSQNFAFRIQNGTFPVKVANNTESGENTDNDGDAAEEKILEEEEKTRNSLGEIVDGPQIYTKNVKLSDIETMLEIGEIYPILGQFSENYQLHFDYVSNETPIEAEVANKIQALATSSGLSLGLPSSGQPLPPSSLHSFKRLEKGIKSLLLNDFTDSYQNAHLSSVFDVFSDKQLELEIASDENIAKLVKFSGFLANSILDLAGLDSTSRQDLDLEADANYVKNLTICLFSDPKCEMFKRVLPVTLPLREDDSHLKVLEKIRYRYAGTYTSGASFNSANVMLAHIIHNLIGQSLGEFVNQIPLKDDPVDLKEMDLCQMKNVNDHSSSNTLIFDAVNETYICYRTPFSHHYLTISPAINEHLSLGLKSEEELENVGRYSTYAESMWSANSFQLEMFYENNGANDLGYLVLGVLFFAATCYSNYWLNLKADILFGGSI